jgi:hypothetical protein
MITPLRSAARYFAELRADMRTSMIISASASGRVLALAARAMWVGAVDASQSIMML